MSGENNPSKKRIFVFTLLIAGAALLYFGLHLFMPKKVNTDYMVYTSGTIDKSPIEKEADNILRRMSNYMTGLRKFSYTSKSTHEGIDYKDKKFQKQFSADVLVKRPNKLKAHLKGDTADLTFYYDGSMFTLMGNKTRMYAQKSAPSNLDQALDSIGKGLNIDPPAADLLYENPYDGLVSNVQTGKLVGVEKIDNIQCDHLQFKGKEISWDLWIEQGETPLPRKYMITSLDIPQNPKFTVELSKWDTTATVSNEDFVFTPPKDAVKITFRDRSQKPVTKNRPTK